MLVRQLFLQLCRLSSSFVLETIRNRLTISSKNKERKRRKEDKEIVGGNDEKDVIEEGRGGRRL